MITEVPSEREEFFAQLVKHYEALGHELAPINKSKERSWDSFAALGLPTRKDERFKYVNLRKLYGERFHIPAEVALTASDLAAYVLPECKNSYLAVINGAFDLTLSNISALPAKMIILPFSQAIKSYSTLLNNLWAKSVKDERDPFSALNRALHGEGLFLYVPPKTICEAPLQILHLNVSSHGEVLVSPRAQIFAGAHSSLKVISTHNHVGETAFCINQLTEISVEENARVEILQNNLHANKESWHFDALRATLKRDSYLKALSATTGSKAVRQDYHVQLAGENCEARLNGVWMLGGNGEAHQQIYIDHQAPNCRSMQLFKGALCGSSHSSFEGKIMVRQAAQKTQAFQLNNNLLLSDHARAESKPNLEIFADDVKASHGATVGQLDSEALFYMQARGFDPRVAKSMLVGSFCQEVIGLIDVASLNELWTRESKNFVS